jgi:hypothetical protein
MDPMAKGKGKSTPAQLKQWADLSRRVKSFAARTPPQWETPRQMISMDEIGDSMQDALVRLNELITELKTSPPPPRQDQAETRSPKSLIEAEVERRVAAGERYDRITDLSRSLTEWMKIVSDRPLKPRSIENRLRDWGLWPLPPKK